MICIICIVLLGILSITGYLGSHWWVLDLPVHFRLQYFWSGLVLAVLAGAGGRYIWALLALTLALLNLSMFAPFYFPVSNEGNVDQNRIRLLHLNMGSENEQYDQIVEYITDLNPDLVLLMEVTPVMANELKQRMPKEYRLDQSIDRRKDYGISLFSKIPLNNAEMVFFSPGYSSSIRARVSTPKTTFTLVATHPVAPTTSRGTKWRNEQIHSIAKFCQKTAQPLVVAGDFNTTSFSHVYEDFIQRSGLRDTRKGFGLQPTWPSFTFLPPFQIPIDHCFVSPEITVSDRFVGPDLGSDHYPIVVDLNIPKSTSPKNNQSF